MIIRLTGAIVRALLVVVLLATPSLLLPGMTSDTAQMVMLVAIFGAGLTFFEYASSYPGLVEFRDAPPFNRIRFLSLFLTVVLLALLCLKTAKTSLSRIVFVMLSTAVKSPNFFVNPFILIGSLSLYTCSF